jgi:hypothetical protein
MATSSLDAEVRKFVLAASAATIDRMLACTKDTSKREYSVTEKHCGAHLYRLEQSAAKVFRDGYGGSLW